MLNNLILGVALYAIWLLWSGHYSLLLLSFGAISCLTVVVLVRRMGVFEPERQHINLLLPLPLYWPWVLWAIFVANLDIAWRVLHPKLTIAPRVFKVKASQKSELGRVIYANSITLTPGTVSLDVEDDTITVHALTEKSASSLQTGEMDRRVTALEFEKEP
jgi:multicomponent Na+:H+ antiporter subunit E